MQAPTLVDVEGNKPANQAPGRINANNQALRLDLSKRLARFVVANGAEMLALDEAEPGDIAYRDDVDVAFQLRTVDFSLVGSWVAIGTVDLAAYATKTELEESIEAVTTAYQDAIADSAGALSETLTDSVIEINAEIVRATTPKFRLQDQRIRFTDLQDTPVITGAVFDNAVTELYWPSIMNVEDKIDNPLGKYYCWLSTNHATSAGGVFLAYANSLAGPWTKAQNAPVYIDTGGGQQTETPHVIWDPVSELFYMYYSQFGIKGAWTNSAAAADQRTLLATSPDGINWTRYGIVIEVPQTLFPGDGHTGYAKIVRFNRDYWVATHLAGGTDNSFNGLSYSYDGLNWHTDPGPTAARYDFSGSNVNKAGYSNLAFINGRMWGFGAVNNVASGIATRFVIPSAAPVSGDLRQWAYPPTPTWQPLQPWQSNDIQSSSLFVDNDGSFYFVYVCGADIGIAKGAFV